MRASRSSPYKTALVGEASFRSWTLGSYPAWTRLDEAIRTRRSAFGELDAEQQSIFSEGHRGGHHPDDAGARLPGKYSLKRVRSSDQVSLILSSCRAPKAARCRALTDSGPTMYADSGLQFR